MQLLPKQEHAIYYLNDDETEELLYGGGAGGGKSALGCLRLIELCQRYAGIRCLMGRSKLKALKETTLNSFFQLANDLNIGDQFKYNAQSNIIYWNNGSEILLKDLFLYPSDPHFDSLGSLEISFAFIDECNQCTYKAVQVVKSRLRYKLKEFGIMPKMLMTCNPAKNWTYSEFYNPSLSNSLRKDRKFIQALPTDNPHLPDSYIRTLESLDEASKKRLLYGDWEFDDNPYSLFEYNNILNLFTNEFIKPTQTRYLTCDIAYTGSDKFVLIVWAGLVIEKIIAIDKIDDTQVSKKINELRIEYRIPLKNVIYDADGLQTFTRNSANSGVLSGATQFNNNAVPIKVNGKKENYKNLKTQCYFMLADMCKDNLIFIQEKNYRTQIIQELEQINRLAFSDDGKLALEKKDAIRERIGRSPDFADAIMMRMLPEIKGKQKVGIIWNN